jgi:hypothetical protein
MPSEQYLSNASEKGFEKINPLGLKGSVGMRDSVFFSQAVRPAGKRFRESDDAEVFMADDLLVAGERALGIEAEMDGGLRVPYPPLGLPKGGASASRGRFRPDIVAESPTARRICKGYRLWVIGYRMGVFGTGAEEGAAAAPERPK